MTALTERQAHLYELIVDYIDEHGFPPTLDEMRRGMGLASRQPIHAMLRLLATKGVIEVTAGASRAIKLTRDRVVVLRVAS